MRKFTKISIGVLVISLTVLCAKQSNVRSTPNLDIQNLLQINQAQAESSDPCNPHYSKWNQGSIYPDGIVCDCSDREEVDGLCE